LHQGQPEYVFYEGPPTANGKPGVHHVLARAFKDIFPRYQTMRGRHVIRRGGWDTHGLPVELEVEKRLGFTSKSQIEEYGIAKFNALCRKSAFDYISDWERLTERIAFWVDLETAYVTFTNEYIESVWWILKQLWEKELLYQGYKVVPYCPRCGTPLSDHEVALGYDTAEDPSVFVRLPLVEDPGTSLLVWTTTPWTLPGNVAVAAHPEVDYVIVERDIAEGGHEKLILAQPLLDKVFGDEEARMAANVRVFETFKGKKLKGLRYQPLFTFLPPDKPAHYVILGDFVTTEDGSGLVHIAPAFGAEDMQAALEYDLPVLMTVNEEGTFIPEVRPWRGKFVKDADPLIIQDLDSRGLLFQAGVYTHTYPFCWRCSTPLLYYARGTWYIRTTQFRERLVALNQEINWYPEHIKEGRFGNWLENNVDWALGRERYWGTPLPIWECRDCRHQLCVGSVAELSERAGRNLSGLDLHRPYVDEILLACPECAKGKMERVPELIDVWFDSGSMPVAQWHYPFENQEVFHTQFPADYICEAVDQTRGWFYSLHAISTLLFDSVSFKNVICLGLILDAQGYKMSKSRGNIVNPWDVLQEHGADAFRWYLYTASPPGQERRFSIDLVGEVVRNFTLMLWNVYAFFVTYANLDGWKPVELTHDVAYNDLDRWLLSELHALVRAITHALDNYDVPGATRPIQTFVEDLSKWYLRRSRRRFWKSGSDADKMAAYATLYEVLVTLSKLLAPTMPFLAEELYQNLVLSTSDPTGVPESVHLADWPSYNPKWIDERLNQDMRLVTRLASLGHSARNQAAIKVRQPLAQVDFSVTSREEAAALQRFADLLADELNVKQIHILGSTGEAVSYSLKPLPKQLGQKYKGLFPKVAQAIQTVDPELAARNLLAGQPVQVEVNGEILEVLPEEVEVRAEARTGLVVSTEGPYLAALHTGLTEALAQEGLAREFVRRVQELRKQAGFEIADRISLQIHATDRLAAAIHNHQDYIQGETLAVRLALGKLSASQPKSAPVEGETLQASADLDFEGEKANLLLIRQS
jgi:isoleucyl-tRNA synthetase